MGLLALDPVDLNTGWDLTTRRDVKRLKGLIQKHRPLHVHLAPVCRISNQAFHPKRLVEDYMQDGDY